MTEQRNAKPRLRSRLWFDNPDNPGMTALYLERYLNYGLTRRELTSGRPIIAIAQTGSDLSPCNRHHIELAKRVREGIRDAGGVALNSRFTRSRRPASGRPRRSIAISPISGSSNFCTATLSTGSCLPPAATRPRRPA
jgi:dihydroxyacid dehydratase/phosphogluconate dehydratase